MENNKINPYMTVDDVEKILSAESIEIDKYLKMYLTKINEIVPPLTPETEKEFLQNLDDKKKTAETYRKLSVFCCSNC
ncbi:MAG: hypothetical protein NC040_09040 [Muribaculaceae bacterium]|nr:hypothetical protein [Alistipes senegalensis]MCM1474192.1 hypothetical protein [Muribaculaceae bacterium]